MEKIELIIDDREEMNSITTERLDALEKRDVFDIKRERLLVGDILVKNKNVIIEVKSIGDYYGSITSTRIFEQAYNMNANYDNCSIIIIGDFKKLFKGMKRFNQREASTITNICLGAYASLVEKYHIKVYWVENNYQFSKMVQYIADKANEIPEVKDIVKLSFTRDQRWTSMLTAIEKIGSNKAKAIAKKYPNMKSLCLATEEDLRKIGGIGPKIAKNIMTFIE